MMFCRNRGQGWYKVIMLGDLHACAYGSNLDMRVRESLRETAVEEEEDGVKDEREDDEARGGRDGKRLAGAGRDLHERAGDLPRRRVGPQQRHLGRRHGARGVLQAALHLAPAHWRHRHRRLRL